MWPPICHCAITAISSQQACFHLSCSMTEFIFTMRAAAGEECLSWIEPPLPRKVSEESAWPAGLCRLRPLQSRCRMLRLSTLPGEPLRPGPAERRNMSPSRWRTHWTYLRCQSCQRTCLLQRVLSEFGLAGAPPCQHVCHRQRMLPMRHYANDG